MCPLRLCVRLNRTCCERDSVYVNAFFARRHCEVFFSYEKCDVFQGTQAVFKRRSKNIHVLFQSQV